MSAPTGITRGFTIVRRLDAPREVVFRAWTDPEHLHWFVDTAAPGTRRPTTVDLRVGGAWRVHMVESEERSYTTGGIYREIVPPEKLVFTWGAVDGWPEVDPARLDDAPVVTVLLKDEGATTEMTFEVRFPDQFSEEMVRGWCDTLDRLDPYLASL